LTLSDRRRVIEAIPLAIGLVLGCLLACDTNSTHLDAGLFPALSYLPVLLLLAAAVRFGGRGASAAILVATVEVLVFAMRGHAPFAGGPAGGGVLSVQLFLAVMAMPAILLAALIEELQRANGRLSAVLDGISDCYYTLDRDGRITGLNAKAAAWWGAGSPQALIGRYYREVTGERGSEPSWTRRAIEGGVPVHEEMFSANSRWIDVSAYPSPRGLNVFYHDVTERKTAERAARAMQDLLQSSLDALSAHIAILDNTGRIIAVNAAWRKAAELAARSGENYFVGANYLEECERARSHQRMIGAGLRRVMRNEIDEFRCEFASDIIAGAWFQLRGTRFGAEAELRLVLAYENITEVKTAEAALRHLTGELLRLQDEERRRIARELHDSTAQNLLGAALGIGQGLRLARRLNATARAALEESRSLIEQSQREIRTVSYLLHPPMLDEAGLPAALRWFCEGFAKRTGIQVGLNIASGIDRLPAELAAALFRIVQEGLTNVHRHSGSLTARVELRPVISCGKRPTILLTIKDDGKGMSNYIAKFSDYGRSSCEVRNSGIGLAGMRERLHQFGGDLQILSSPRGTTVRVTAPLPADADAASARDAGA
jgi:two-component system NarL family sensor kinase